MFAVKSLLKSIWKAMKKMWKHLVFRIFCYLLMLVVFLLLPYLLSLIKFENEVVEGLFEKLSGFLLDTLSISVVFGAIINEIRIYNAKSKEDSKKTEQDEHKIIRKYTGKNGHIIGYREDKKHDYYDDEKNGYIMQITNLDHKYEGLLHTETYDIHDKHRLNKEEYIKYFIAGKDVYFKKEDGTTGMIHVPPFLNLSSLNVFTNFEGKLKITVKDEDKVKELPDLLVNILGQVMTAHKFSKTTNSETIRLKDFSFDRETNELKLETERSTYYNMLATNRCMDYDIDGMTLRDIYEYRPKISPLIDSELGNQIGINGVIITKDGYLLVEKRDKNKSTWKNKFGQPISLALKVLDFFKEGETILKDDTLEEKFISMLKKTLKTNYGLVGDDLKEISMSKNFMGIARDLLEGGKPNFYFYVELNLDSKQTAIKMQKHASLNVNVYDENKKIIEEPLKAEKLTSDFYLIHFDNCKVDFDYGMFVRPHQKNNPSIYVRRRLYPRKWHFYLSRYTKYYLTHSRKEKLKYTKRGVKYSFLTKHRECGQALLVCFSYLELIKDRIPNLGGKE